jgi:DNA polymerase I-like protein with 3'-5' exonuclease and polymerase domains
MRTMRFIFPEPHPDPEIEETRRNVVKKVTYTHAYGGTLESLSRQVGLPEATVKQILEKINERTPQIAELRQLLHAKAQNDGFIRTPFGTEVEVEDGDHPGKVLGLYAQTLSSEVVEGAYVRVYDYLKGRRNGSCIIFPLHDELVIDMHPKDFECADVIRGLMEDGGHVVKLKKGRSYGEAS